MKRRLAAVAVTSLLLAGCGDRSPSVTDPHSPEARRIADLWWLMFWIATGVYVIVAGLVLWSMLRTHADDAAHLAPDQPAPATERRSHRLIVVGGLVVPALILAVVGFDTVRTTRALQSEGATVRIDVRAERWWWRLTYPGTGVESANEIHVPVGELVDLTLTSDEVIHSVWVPQLGGKVDVIPGQPNHLRFTASAAGTYRGQCAEFCGIGHAKMAFVVVADPPEQYAAWLRANAAPAGTPAANQAQAGEALFLGTSCAGCHAVRGTTAAGTLGPDLTHLGSRASLAAATLPNDPAHLGDWLARTQQIKPGALMPQIDLTADQVAALVAYLGGLT